MRAFFMNRILLLTACVNPNGMSFTALQDVEERKKQYLKAIDWYLENTSLDIVVVENTCYDLSESLNKKNQVQRLEFLTFDGNNFDKTLGKGYGEALILKYAFHNSKKIKTADSIIKVTGRLIVSNINKLISCCKKENTLYIKESYQNNRMYFESNFFVAPPAFFYLFIDNYEKLNDSKGYYFEHLMYDLASDWEKTGGKIKELTPPVLFLGQSGSTGQFYPNNTYYKIRSYVLFLFHRLGIYRFG